MSKRGDELAQPALERARWEPTASAVNGGLNRVGGV